MCGAIACDCNELLCPLVSLLKLILHAGYLWLSSCHMRSKVCPVSEHMSGGSLYALYQRWHR